MGYNPARAGYVDPSGWYRGRKDGRGTHSRLRRTGCGFLPRASKTKRQFAKYCTNLQTATLPNALLPRPLVTLCTRRTSAYPRSFLRVTWLQDGLNHQSAPPLWVTQSATTLAAVRFTLATVAFKLQSPTFGSDAWKRANRFL